MAETLPLEQSGGCYVDSHAHLSSPEFDPDREAVIARARAGGVELILEVALSDSRRGFARAIALAERYEFVYLAIGIHPHDARRYSSALEEKLFALAGHPKVIAWGEIGLDYHYDHSPPERQREVFARQLRLARIRGLPVIIHTRDAEADTLAILREHWQEKGRQGVMHCFTGSANLARTCLEEGFYISFSGIVTFKNAATLRKLLLWVPMDRVLIETDSPYLAPVPHRGRRNEPLYVREVARQLAEIRELFPPDIGRITSYNFRRLFEKRLRPEHRFYPRRTIVYQIRDSLYVNLTNRCTALCVFCTRVNRPISSGYWLGMSADEEPTADEVIAAIGDPRRYREIVFCGYGEPTLKLGELIEVGRFVKAHGGRVRVDTIGHANLIHGRNVLPECVGAVDEFSISLNAGDREQYEKLVRSEWPERAFDAAIEFAREAVRQGFLVTLTAVRLPNLNIKACRKIAERIGARFRIREYVAMTGTEFWSQNRQ
jgi:TatD DNase family protein